MPVLKDTQSSFVATITHSLPVATSSPSLTYHDTNVNDTKQNKTAKAHTARVPIATNQQQLYSVSHGDLRL
jgi:hypothetical protein